MTSCGCRWVARLPSTRAVAHKPSLLLLDETTSHLDVRGASRLRSTLSTIENADVVLVLEEGVVVEQDLGLRLPEMVTYSRQ